MILFIDNFEKKCCGECTELKKVQQKTTKTSFNDYRHILKEENEKGIEDRL